MKSGSNQNYGRCSQNNDVRIFNCLFENLGGWRWPAKKFNSTVKILIRGTEDGGPIDAIRIVIKNFDQERLVENFLR